MKHKLTLGLLASMCIRYDHGFFMEYEETSTLFPKQNLMTERKNIIDKMIIFYEQGTGLDEVSSRQILEELDGSGFYSVENNHSYEWMWNRFPELLIHCERALHCPCKES